MAGEGDDIMVICAAFSQRNLRNVPGNREGRCAECRRRIVVSPDARRLVPDPGYAKRYVCIRCAQTEAPDETAEPLPGAIGELAKRIGPLGAIVAGSQMKRTRLGDFDADELDGPADA